MKPALFLHPQKTAGTSIILALRERYGVAETASHGDFAMSDISDRAFISGHFGFAFAEPLFPNRTTFTFLRDPIDRVISLYNFCRARSDASFPIYAAAQRWDFEEFVERCSDRPSSSASNDDLIVYESVWNNLAWQFAFGWGGDLNSDGRRSILEFDESELLRDALKNIERFDIIGTVEKFNRDIQRICIALGLSDLKVGRHNESPPGVSRSNLTASVIRKIERATELDRHLYESVIRKGV